MAKLRLRAQIGGMSGYEERTRSVRRRATVQRGIRILARRQPRLRRALAVLALPWLASGLSGSALHAQKTDTLTLVNGDRITGEIKALKHGKLRYDTDAASNIYVEWDNVRFLWTEKFLEIELESGERLFGSIVPADSAGRLRVQGVRRSPTVNLLSVVSITPIERGFWSQLDGLFEFGLDYKKQNNTFNYTLKSEVNWRPRNWIVTLSADSYLLTQDSLDDQSRNNALLQVIRLLDRRWFIAAQTKFEENQELDLDLRSALAAGGGRGFIRNNNVEWVAWLGLSVNRERFSGIEATENLEGLLSSTFQWFVFGAHDTDLTATLAALPGLTDWGRFRLDFDVDFRRDLFLDFYIGFNFYDNFDSRPPEGGAKNDLGLGFRLGYDF